MVYGIEFLWLATLQACVQLVWINTVKLISWPRLIVENSGCGR